MSRPSALIVGPGSARGAMPAVRSLGRAGWDVGVGAPEPTPLAGCSRFATHVHHVPRPEDGLDAFVTAIETASARQDYDVVFGTADGWVVGLASVADRITPRVAHPPREIVDRSLDKLNLTRAAAEVSLATPMTRLATDEAVSAWTGPAVVKARSYWLPGEHPAVSLGVRITDGPSATAARVADLRRAGAQPLLQEVVRGELIAVTGVRHRGRLVGRVQQRAVTTSGGAAGVSARATTTPLDHALVARVEALLTELGWNGLAEVQLLRDAEGTCRLIDLNGRFYGSLALALHAGVDLPVLWARSALGDELPEVTDARPGARYVWLRGEIERIAHTSSSGARDVVDLLRWLPGSTGSVWDLADPPVLSGRWWRRLARALARRISGRLAPRSGAHEDMG